MRSVKYNFSDEFLVKILIDGVVLNKFKMVVMCNLFIIRYRYIFEKKIIDVRCLFFNYNESNCYLSKVL